MLSKNDKVLVAVSGGPDSVAMLYLLRTIAPELNLKLHLAHLNHMLRPKEAQKDVKFVISLAEKLHLPLTTAKIDVSAFVEKEGLSLEEGARILRYRFFLKTAKKIGARKIAVAHSQDDQAETVLMRLIRGSGLLGLSAISPVRKLNNCLIIRPAINISRREILKFLKQHKINYRLDSSNKKTVFLRNKIRGQLLPYLKKNYKSRISEILSRSAENISLDYQFLNQAAQKIFKRIVKFKKETLWLPLKYFQTYHVSLQKQLLRLAVKKIKGDLNKIEERHYNLLLALAQDKKSRVLELPARILVSKINAQIVFSKKGKTKIIKYPLKVKLKIPGQTKLPKLNLTIEANLLRKIKLGKIRHKKSRLLEYLDYGQLKRPLFIRFRKKGDKFQPLGMKGVKTLKEFFIDEKVPRDKRDTTPLLTDKQDIIWVAGYRISQKVKITPKTMHILTLRLRKN